MDILEVKRKRRRLTIGLAIVGFLVATVIWAYSELTDSSAPHFNLALWTAFIVLCPPSLLSAPLIDVEPGSSGFTMMWLVIGLVNSGLYGAIGMVFGKLRWKPETETVLAGNGS